MPDLLQTVIDNSKSRSGAGTQSYGRTASIFNCHAISLYQDLCIWCKKMWMFMDYYSPALGSWETFCFPFSKRPWSLLCLWLRSSVVSKRDIHDREKQDFLLLLTYPHLTMVSEQVHTVLISHIYPFVPLLIPLLVLNGLDEPVHFTALLTNGVEWCFWNEGVFYVCVTQ